MLAGRQYALFLGRTTREFGDAEKEIPFILCIDTDYESS